MLLKEGLGVHYKMNVPLPLGTCYVNPAPWGVYSLPVEGVHKIDEVENIHAIHFVLKYGVKSSRLKTSLELYMLEMLFRKRVKYLVLI